MKNRPIKFRCWNGEKMFYQDEGVWFNFGWKGQKCIEIDHSEFCENLILMQYTGLKDKQRKEIYEGDILRSNFNYHGKKDKRILAPVFYEETEAEFQVSVPTKINSKETYPEHLSLFLSWAEPKVIGNIYSNPKILK